MDKTWFISDTHWGHSKIIEYCNRPFYNINDMNEKLIQNWNSCVGKNDVVYHLGDFAFGDKNFVSDIVSQLNGRIRLICGNHDTHNNQWYRDCGFEEAYHTPIIVKDFLVLSHEPHPFMFKNENLKFIYGHIHNNKTFPTWTKNTFCVCVEQHNYMPINIEEIIKKWEEENE